MKVEGSMEKRCKTPGCNTRLTEDDNGIICRFCNEYVRKVDENEESEDTGKE